MTRGRDTCRGRRRVATATCELVGIAIILGWTTAIGCMSMPTRNVRRTDTASSRAADTIGPYELKLRGTQRKLRAALERLVAGRPTHPKLNKSRYRFTVTTLAREARVGRNAIYTNHRALIEELRE